MSAKAARSFGKAAAAPKSGGGAPGRTLLFITICFIASAVVRVGDVGGALAQNAGVDPLAMPERTALPSVPAPSARTETRRGSEEPVGNADPASCAAPNDSLLSAIRERVAALDAREQRLADREGKLSVAETQVRAEIERLVEAEKALAATLALADGAAERDVAHLVGVYETMKPKDAAKLFTEMEPTFAAGFLARMRAESAAGVFAAMEPNAAYAVTVIMAGRHVGEGVAPGLSSLGGPVGKAP
ncbi:MotE family protein [Rubrimonas cliftonensis]|uniref:Flagellar motility protein MotE, a chaperone for MotC folding n=1 Tax=Rubrimonas cliftonensis TaxID=89524 RepID=A0A1H4C6M9_9RHOB|nr:hypothetical protein [Rubrimonas cliftonensis]SEA56028.1 Flagellar motility protein MotE, a chaperone for MotC folding [Rubrimonas cliftonensis]